jgi:hypothetical protein
LFYGAITDGEEVIRTQDCIEISVSNTSTHLGVVEGLYEDVSLSRRRVSCRRFFFPEDTEMGRVSLLGKNEVLSSNETSVYDLDQVQTTCVILPGTTIIEILYRMSRIPYDLIGFRPQEEEEEGESKGNVYYYQFEYEKGKNLRRVLPIEKPQRNINKKRKINLFIDDEAEESGEELGSDESEDEEDEYSSGVVASQESTGGVSPGKMLGIYRKANENKASRKVTIDRQSLHEMPSPAISRRLRFGVKSPESSDQEFSSEKGEDSENDRIQISPQPQNSRKKLKFQGSSSSSQPSFDLGVDFDNIGEEEEEVPNFDLGLDFEVPETNKIQISSALKKEGNVTNSTPIKSERASSGLTIIATKDITMKSDIVTSLRHQLGVNVIVSKLNVADFVVGTRIGVLRRFKADLINEKTKDNAVDLSEAFQEPFVIIENDDGPQSFRY